MSTVIWIVPWWLVLIILWVEAGSNVRAAKKEAKRDAAQAEQRKKWAEEREREERKQLVRHINHPLASDEEIAARIKFNQWRSSRELTLRWKARQLAQQWDWPEADDCSY
jgi:flagellar biosynthesis/type III secretory pathway M-ring protein FliF/YscJ